MVWVAIIIIAIVICWYAFSRRSHWALRLPAMKISAHLIVEELYAECISLLSDNDYEIKTDKTKLTLGIETKLEAWCIEIISSCMVFKNILPKKDDEEFWLALVYAIADTNAKRREKNIEDYMPLFKRYHHTGYPIKKPEEGKGVCLVAKDLTEHLLNCSPPTAVKLLQGKIIEYDKKLCYEVIRHFGYDENAENALKGPGGKNMFDWIN